MEDTSKKNIVNKKNALYFAILNTMLFGSNYVWAKLALDYVSPVVSILICDAIGMILLIIYAKLKGMKLKIKGEKEGYIIQIFLVIANFTMLFGLKYTSSANVAFITQLTVVFVPLLESLIEKKKPKLSDVFIILLALVGLAIITLDFKNISVNIGDLIIVISSLAYSINIVLLTKRENTTGDDSVQLTFTSYLMAITVAVILLILFGVGDGAEIIKMSQPIFIFAILADTFSYLFSMVIQASITNHLKSEVISLLYCLEPVTTVIIAFVVLGEVMNLQTVMGSAIIIVSILISFAKTSKNK